MSTLKSGSRIGHYEVRTPLGAGGMGAVYRALDTKLGRDVALKVLPDQFAGDPDRLSRFQREARVLASLNHPHIGQIYGVEESAGAPCLVLELVEGPTLEERLKRGPILWEEALEISRQICDGLDAAHGRGIMHRDLKPANVKLTSGGEVKVLDFGLAKIFENHGPERDLSQSPTVLSGATRPNVILGTLAYMSPEQVRGQPADERSDIWAFGCVLYEMLSGKHAFAGATFADIVGAITKSEPDWSVLPAWIPPGILTLLRRCLHKDNKRRLHHIADARIEIEDALQNAVGTGTAKPARRSLVSWIAGAGIGAIIGAAFVFVATVYFRDTPTSAPKMRLAVPIPVQTNQSTVISPDSRSIVFDMDYQGKPQLWIRTLDSPDSQPLAGTDGGGLPFWSTDGNSIGFFANGKLKRIDRAGGPANVITDAPNARGGAWNSNGTILFNATSSGPLSRVSVNGGDPVPATQLLKDQGSHRYPHFLPDGHHFLYYALGKPEVSGVYLGSLDSLESKRIVAADAQAVYAPPGYLLFLRQGILLAQPFDVRKLELTGTARSLAEHVATSYTGLMLVSASDSGAIAYRTSANDAARLTWLDRRGTELGTFGPVGGWGALDLSKDQTRVATQKVDNGNMDIWMVEVARGVATKLTSNPADDEWPVWSPDGKQIAFDSNRRGPFDLYRMAIDDIGKETAFLESSNTKGARSWSSDGHNLLYVILDQISGFNLWIYPFAGEAKPFRVSRRDFAQFSGAFSPDNRWVAYESSTSGTNEVYVQAFPDSGEAWRISLAGGQDLRWRDDGKEVFYIAPDGILMAVEVAVVGDGKQIQPGKPEKLFQTSLSAGRRVHGYAVARDGQRFLLPVVIDKTSPPITILLNWAER